MPRIKPNLGQVTSLDDVITEHKCIDEHSEKLHDMFIDEFDIDDNMNLFFFVIEI